jgi:hypothetical protein
LENSRKGGKSKGQAGHIKTDVKNQIQKHICVALLRADQKTAKFSQPFQHTSKRASIGRGLARFVGRRFAVPLVRAC